MLLNEAVVVVVVVGAWGGSVEGRRGSRVYASQFAYESSPLTYLWVGRQVGHGCSPGGPQVSLRLALLSPTPFSPYGMFIILSRPLT